MDVMNVQSSPTTLFGVDVKNGVGQVFTPKTVQNLFKKVSKIEKQKLLSDANILYIIGKLSKDDIEDS